MRNYKLMRFVKLSLYFFAMYTLLTCIWYAITGKFENGIAVVVREIMITSAIFSFAFSLFILGWYRRTSIRIPVKAISKKDLHAKIEATGFIKTDSGEQPFLVYKPTPPKASALAGKLFVEQDVNFYHLHGPKKFLKRIWEK